MALAAAIQIADQDVNTISASQGGEVLGQIATTSDGRTFVYSRAGAADLANGKLTNSPAVVANDINRVLGSALPAGSNKVTITLGGTATSDQYKGGYFVVNDSVGEGQSVYSVQGNTAATSGSSNSTIVSLFGATTTALTSVSDVSLYPNLNSATVLAAADAAIPVTGVPTVAVTAGYYYWSQVGGYASVLSAGAITKNANAIVSASVQGAATIQLAASVTQVVGFAPELTVDTEFRPLFLTINA